MTKLIFELGAPGRRAVTLPQPAPGMPEIGGVLGKENLRADAPMLPEAAENEVVRHYTALSKLNFGVDSGFYPLGSCTMKYNPKINEKLCALDGFAGAHPYQRAEDVQGCLALIYELERKLCRICGMDAFTLQPAAGAHGELTGLMIMAAYHQKRNDAQRRVVLVPDSAHGTNPASAALAGFEVRQVPSNEHGMVDLEALRALAGPDTSGLMLTNPNTLGIFDRQILSIAAIVHDAGGLLYYDGANFNAVVGKTTPAAMGFDIVHLNLHKTFGTPHGGGGPGAGPVGVVEKLRQFLPVPRVIKEGEAYRLDSAYLDSIGRVRSFYGNFGVLVRAYAYILSNGAQGLDEISTAAVLNANYIMRALSGHFEIPYENEGCMHEFVLSAEKQKAQGASALDLAKGLIDRGYHPPTIYFPLIVHEAMMIEPTESESRETLDAFIAAMCALADLCESDAQSLHEAPVSAPIGRTDEAAAARHPVLTYRPE